jgi:hypothetical protein
MSHIRIVVADQAEAIFYDLSSLKARPNEVARTGISRVTGRADRMRVSAGRVMPSRVKTTRDTARQSASRRRSHTSWNWIGATRTMSS